MPTPLPDNLVDWAAHCLGRIDGPLVTTGVGLSIVTYGALSLVMHKYYAACLTLLLEVFGLVFLGTAQWLRHGNPWDVGLFEEAFDPELVLLSNLMLVYQIFNLVVTIHVEDLRSVALFVHHVAAAMLAVASLGPTCIAYASYFFGVIEVSNVPLTVRDLILFYRKSSAGADPKAFALLELGSGTLFALSFYATRVVGWALVSYNFWAQALREVALANSGGAVYAVSLFMGTNVLLGGLQVSHLRPTEY